MGSVYFVVSTTDSPEAIFFSPEDAFAAGFEFIDAFDDEGCIIISYKLIGECEYAETTEDDYTTDF